MITASVAATRNEAGSSAPAGAPSRLHLVDSIDRFGPISPELVLVDPELARAVRATLPELAPPFALRTGSPDDRPRLVPVEPDERAWRVDETPRSSDGGDARRVLFDTPDRSLRRHDLTLERRLGNGRPRWRLTLPLGEVVKARGATGSDDPPSEIAALLHGVVGAQPLVPVPWHSDSNDFARLQDYVLQQLRSMLRHEPGIRLGADPENLHQFRVAGRRLRTALKVGGRFVDAGWAASVKGELASLARITGPLRDLDLILERLGHEPIDPADREGLAVLAAELCAEHASLQERLLRLLDGVGYRGLLDRLERPIEAAQQSPKHSLSSRAARGSTTSSRMSTSSGGSRRAAICTESGSPSNAPATHSSLAGHRESEGQPASSTPRASSRRSSAPTRTRLSPRHTYERQP